MIQLQVAFRKSRIVPGSCRRVNEQYRVLRFCLEDERVLYIVAAGWLYVVLMMSITERSIAAGLSTFFFYGVVPLSVMLYLLATPARRRAAKAREHARIQALARDSVRDPDQGA